MRKTVKERKKVYILVLIKSFFFFFFTALQIKDPAFAFCTGPSKFCSQPCLCRVGPSWPLQLHLLRSLPPTLHSASPELLQGTCQALSCPLACTLIFSPLGTLFTQISPWSRPHFDFSLKCHLLILIPTDHLSCSPHENASPC